MTQQPPKEAPDGKNAPFKSGRRAARTNKLRRPQRDRRLIVRGELREQPDVHKLARALISMAMAEAERETQAQTDAPAQPDSGSEQANE